MWNMLVLDNYVLSEGPVLVWAWILEANLSSYGVAELVVLQPLYLNNYLAWFLLESS